MQSAVALLLSQRSLGLSGDCDRLHDEGVQASQARDDIALFVCAVEITCSFAWIGGKRASLQLTDGADEIEDSTAVSLPSQILASWLLCV
jgi:hypothetical protein